MGFTIEALSAATGISTRQIVRIEAGESTSLDKARRLAAVLGRTINYLFPAEVEARS